MYRFVSDYGYGDKSWDVRFMDESKAIKTFNQRLFDSDDYLKTIDECLNYNHPIYSLETDSYGDAEDWDWMDS